jgi:hypothetical protein
MMILDALLCLARATGCLLITDAPTGSIKLDTVGLFCFNSAQTYHIVQVARIPLSKPVAESIIYRFIFFSKTRESCVLPSLAATVCHCGAADPCSTPPAPAVSNNRGQHRESRVSRGIGSRILSVASDIINVSLGRPTNMLALLNTLAAMSLLPPMNKFGLCLPPTVGTHDGTCSV